MSTNNGLGWSPVNNSLPEKYIIVYLHFTISGNIIFAGTDERVFLPANDISSRVPMNKRLADIGILAMTSSGTNMFTGTKNSGVFVSTNNGLTNPDVQGLAAKRFKYFCSNLRRRCFVSIILNR